MAKKTTYNLEFTVPGAGGATFPAKSIWSQQTPMYAAAKLSVPLSNKLSAFGKAGIGVTIFKQSDNLIASGDFVGESSSTFYEPVFGVGLGYQWADHVSANIQYLYFGQSINTISHSDAATNPDAVINEAHNSASIASLGIAYHF